MARAALRIPSAALDMGIATSALDLALCENLDVVANIYLRREKILAQS